MDTTSVELVTPSNRREWLCHYGLAGAMIPEEFVGSVETSLWYTATELRLPKLEVPHVWERVNQLNEIIRQIRELINGPAEDETGILQPTQYAVDRVVELLIESCNAYLFEEPRRGHFPKADVAPDLEGGIRIEWTLALATVTLVIPPSDTGPKEYLCKRVNRVSKVEFGLSGSTIATWLKRYS